MNRYFQQDSKCLIFLHLTKMNSQFATIAFDAKRLFFNQSGLGNYGRTLVSNLAALYPNNRYLLYSPHLNLSLDDLNQAKASFKLATNMQLRTPKGLWKTKFGGSVWRSVLMGNSINSDNPAIFHGLSNELPFNIGKVKARKFVTIHDLIFLRYPQYYPSFDKWVYLKKWKHSCRNADVIIAISHQTKEDIIEFLGVHPDKIQVVYQACNTAYYYDYNDRLFLNHGLFAPLEYQLPPQVPKEYILYVGAISERKNLLTLVKALHLLKHRLQIPLVVVGRGKEYEYKVWQYLQEHHLTGQVIFIPFLPFDDLKAVYRCARAMVYPSIFEGFGLPIIESLFSRTPVITSTGSCFSEAGGLGTIYVNPLNAEEMADAIEKVLTDGAQQMEMIMQGWEYAQQFKAEPTTTALMKVYGLLG